MTDGDSIDEREKVELEKRNKTDKGDKRNWNGEKTERRRLSFVPLHPLVSDSYSSLIKSSLFVPVRLSSFPLLPAPCSAILSFISSLSHISTGEQYFVYSLHSFNEWSNHSAIKCKQPYILYDKTLPRFSCSAIQLSSSFL